MGRTASPDSLSSRLLEVLSAPPLRTWRSTDLAEKLGEDANDVSKLLSGLYGRGRLSRCEVTIPGRERPLFEYKDKGYDGAPPAEIKPLKSAKPTIVPRTPPAPSVHKEAPQSKPEPVANKLSVAEYVKTLDKIPEAIPSRALAAPVPEETPRRETEASMAAGPVRETSAPADRPTANEGPGNRAASFAISDDGCLGITLHDGSVRMSAADIALMMAFLDKTAPVWRAAA